MNLDVVSPGYIMINVYMNYSVILTCTNINQIRPVWRCNLQKGMGTHCLKMMNGGKMEGEGKGRRDRKERRREENSWRG